MYALVEELVESFVTTSNWSFFPQHSMCVDPVVVQVVYYGPWLTSTMLIQWPIVCNCFNNIFIYVAVPTVTFHSVHLHNGQPFSVEQ
jgi:hypothetical protein